MLMVNKDEYIDEILCIKNGKLLQKYCSLDTIVCALCRHQADVALAPLDIIDNFYVLVKIFINIINVLSVFGEIKLCA